MKDPTSDVELMSGRASVTTTDDLTSCSNSADFDLATEVSLDDFLCTTDDSFEGSVDEGPIGDRLDLVVVVASSSSSSAFPRDNGDDDDDDDAIDVVMTGKGGGQLTRTKKMTGGGSAGMTDSSDDVSGSDLVDAMFVDQWLMNVDDAQR